MSRVKCFFCVVFPCGLAFSYCCAALPKGVSFSEESGLHFSPQVARVLNVETRSLDRDGYITKYVTGLHSSEAADRAWAAYALGSFQSDSALKALLQAMPSESSELVADQLFVELSGLFELFGFPAEQVHGKLSIEDARKRSQAWAQSYAEVGYGGLAHRGWETAKKRGAEGIHLFVSQITSRYDPHLTPLLIEMLGSGDVEAERKQIENAILAWSGYDLHAKSPSEVQRDLRSPDALSNGRICVRYRNYFGTIGCAGPDYTMTEIALAVLLGETDKKASYRREMAIRLMSCAEQ